MFLITQENKIIEKKKCSPLYFDFNCCSVKDTKTIFQNDKFTLSADYLIIPNSLLFEDTFIQFLTIRRQ